MDYTSVPSRELLNLWYLNSFLHKFPSVDNPAFLQALLSLPDVKLLCFGVLSVTTSFILVSMPPRATQSCSDTSQADLAGLYFFILILTDGFTCVHMLMCAGMGRAYYPSTLLRVAGMAASRARSTLSFSIPLAVKCSYSRHRLNCTLHLVLALAKASLKALWSSQAANTSFGNISPRVTLLALYLLVHSFKEHISTGSNQPCYLIY